MEPLNPKTSDQLSDNGDRASKSHGDKSFQTRPPPLPLPNVAILSSIMDLSWLERMKNISVMELVRFSRYINVVLSSFQALAGFLGLFDLAKLDITSFLVSIYTIILAMLLLAFECRFSSMDPWIRSHFGFLFSYRGRTAFLFFVGFMTFGIDSPFAFFIAILMTMHAALNAIMIFSHPEFRRGSLTPNMDPSRSYTQMSDLASETLARNPELVKKAGTALFQHAKENPEVAVKIGQHYVANAGKYVPPSTTVANQ
ncbi:hypothetical protein ABG067_004752 [Albugo candida]